MRWFLALTLWSCAGSSQETKPASSRMPMKLAPAGEAFTATVMETLDAGPYDYQRVDDGTAERWVVSLSPAPETGRIVRVKPFGTSTDFHSARTGRTFASLTFAVVRSLEVP